LFMAFPDLKLELISNKQASNGMISAPWLLFGTHQGPVGELEPSGKSVVLPGWDFITVDNGKIKQVLGYFDPAYLFQQLG
ncbi:MAG: ester cyclase, partial [Pseudomonadota bacterium]